MYKHTKQDEELLGTLSQEEKLKRTTPEAFKERGALLVEEKSYYVTKNEMPYEGVQEHLLVWEKEDSIDTFLYLKYMCEQGYTVLKNPQKKASVNRSHWHLIKE